MNKKAWIIFASVCVVLIAGLVYMSNKNRIDVSNVDLNAIQQADPRSGSIGDHVFGKADSKVVLVEHGDFQCPACGSAHPTVKKLTEKYKDQMAFVFRNFPLTNLHPNARAAAGAVEAAGLQNNYWQMHNYLFENQNAWSSLSSDQRTEYFVVSAKQLGLNGDTLKSDMSSDRISMKINFDRALGNKAGVTATPSFFLNGTKVPDDVRSDADKFETYLRTEMEKQGIKLPKQ